MHTCACGGGGGGGLVGVSGWFCGWPAEGGSEAPKDNWRTHKLTHTHTHRDGAVEGERESERQREISSCWGMKISPTYKKANFGLLFLQPSLSHQCARRGAREKSTKHRKPIAMYFSGESATALWPIPSRKAPGNEAAATSNGSNSNKHAPTPWGVFIC